MKKHLISNLMLILDFLIKHKNNNKKNNNKKVKIQNLIKILFLLEWKWISKKSKVYLHKINSALITIQIKILNNQIHQDLNKKMSLDFLMIQYKTKINKYLNKKNTVSRKLLLLLLLYLKKMNLLLLLQHNKSLI